jgi:nicotinamidase-related amidase
MLEVNGKRVPTSIEEVIDPAHSALLIIDMQNDFCAADGSAAQCGSDVSMYEDIVPRIVALAEACRARRVPVINVRMLSLADGASDSPSWIRLKMRASGNADGSQPQIWSFATSGTWGADFLPALKPKPGDLLVTKLRSSAFHNTDLDQILRARGIQTVLVCGCTTEGCVESTVRDAGFHDYFAVVVRDCVASDVPELHEASLLVMAAYRADVTTASEAINQIRTHV